MIILMMKRLGEKCSLLIISSLSTVEQDFNTWAVGLFLGKRNLSELKKLDELIIIRSSVFSSPLIIMKFELDNQVSR